MKTPVSRLRFSLEILRENRDENDRARYLSSFERDLGELELLIGELLKHARFDRTVAHGTFEQVDFDNWLEEIICPYADFSGKIVFEGKGAEDRG